jgi:microtubule-associated protein-like 6
LISSRYSPKGDTIAVGSVDGYVYFLDSQDFSEKGKKKERVERVSDIKFSPNGLLVAVGTHDNFIDIYNSDTFRREAVCKGHSSYITHLGNF